jgi:hypothetical protein
VTDRRAGLARALGGPQERRRRHRRFLAAAVALLLVAAVLLLLGGRDDDDDFAEQAAPICDEFEARLRREFELSFPDGVPTPEAEEIYLSHAFADTTQELVDALAALEPSGDARAGVEAMQALVDQLRDDPSVGVGTNPFTATVAPRFDTAGASACGSGFLAA